MSLEITQSLYYGIQVVMAHRAVYEPDVIHIHGVQLLDVVIQLEQCLEYGGIGHAGSVAQHAHLGLREELVTQCHHIVHNTGKLRIGGRLAVAGKGKNIGLGTVGLHFLQGGTKHIIDLLPGGTVMLGMMGAVTSALAIDAVKSTYLTVGRHKVDT